MPQGDRAGRGPQAPGSQVVCAVTPHLWVLLSLSSRRKPRAETTSAISSVVCQGLVTALLAQLCLLWHLDFSICGLSFVGIILFAIQLEIISMAPLVLCLLGSEIEPPQRWMPCRSGVAMDPWMIINTVGSSLSVGSLSVHLNWGSKTLRRKQLLLY